MISRTWKSQKSGLKSVEIRNQLEIKVISKSRTRFQQVSDPSTKCSKYQGGVARVYRYSRNFSLYEIFADDPSAAEIHYLASFSENWLHYRPSSKILIYDLSAKYAYRENFWLYGNYMLSVGRSATARSKS